MENATKALLIAGGVLIAILIITLFVSVLQNTGKVSKAYNSSISSEQITSFNNNFTKYLGQDLTIHEVVTICNFARQNTTKTVDAPVKYDESKISQYIEIKEIGGKKYKYIFIINIDKYDDNGFISQITFKEKLVEI